MIKKTITKIAAILIIAASITSCNSDDDAQLNSSLDNSRAALLLSSPWVYSSYALEEITFNPSDASQGTIEGALTEFVTASTITFNDNNTGTYFINNSSTPFTWTFGTNNITTNITNLTFSDFTIIDGVLTFDSELCPSVGVETDACARVRLRYN